MSQRQGVGGQNKYDVISPCASLPLLESWSNSRLTDRIVLSESQLVGQSGPRCRIKVARQCARDELDEDGPAVRFMIGIGISQRSSGRARARGGRNTTGEEGGGTHLALALAAMMS